MASKKPKVKTQRTKVVCISHKEDADGISSAALIRQAFGGDSVLVDYPSQMEAIQKVCADEKLKSMNAPQFRSIMHSNQNSLIMLLLLQHVLPLLIIWKTDPSVLNYFKSTID